MTSKKILLIAGLSAFAVGCSAAQTTTANVSQKSSAHQVDMPQVEKHQAPHQAHTKLSAAIDFKTDFDGRGNLGVTQTVNLTVTSLYPGSSASFEVLPTPGLQMFQKSGLTETFSVLGEGGHDLSFQFQPLSEGVHDIVILAQVSLADGQFMTKSHLVQVYVGDEFQRSKEKVGTFTPATTSQEVGGMVIMDAEETVD